jgi:hypothetical protein
MRQSPSIVVKRSFDASTKEMRPLVAYSTFPVERPLKICVP